MVTSLKDIDLYFLTKSICCWLGFYAERLYGAKPIDNLINSEKDKNAKSRETVVKKVKRFTTL